MIPMSSPFSDSLNNESINSDLGDCVRMAALYLEISGHERDPTTAAIDGTSARPGGPWETSIPTTMVGISFTRGTQQGLSIARKEFIPPSFELILIRTFVRYCSVILVGQRHCVTIPNLHKLLIFQGPYKSEHFRSGRTHKMNSGSPGSFSCNLSNISSTLSKGLAFFIF
uniref:Uncharacterized protein n=1 Tax=Opuntia streptacantha TaxID=393608 RepID=A0A7C9E2A3_OPUST